MRRLIVLFAAIVLAVSMMMTASAQGKMGGGKKMGGRMAGGKMRELTEYLDTELVATALADPA